MFRSGKITPDMMLLLIEPAIYLLVAIGDMVGIEVKVFPEEDMDTTLEEESAMLAELDKSGSVESVEAPVEVTKDLLSTIKAQVTNKGVK